MGLINWYVRKYWGSDYIHKDAIKDTILDVRRKDAEAFEKRLSEELAHLSELKNLDCKIACSALQSKIAQLEGQIEASRRLKKLVERRELVVKETAQANVSMALEFKYVVNQLLESVAAIAGKTDILTTSASEHHDAIERRLMEYQISDAKLPESLPTAPREDKISGKGKNGCIQ